MGVDNQVAVPGDGAIERVEGAGAGLPFDMLRGGGAGGTEEREQHRAANAKQSHGVLLNAGDTASPAVQGDTLSDIAACRAEALPTLPTLRVVQG